MNEVTNENELFNVRSKSFEHDVYMFSSIGWKEEDISVVKSINILTLFRSKKK